MKLALLTNSSQLTRFLLVGGAGTVANLILFVGCIEFLHIHYLVASLLAFLTTFTSKYTWNRIYTFTERVEPEVGQQYFLFTIVSFLALAANLLILEICMQSVVDIPVLGQAIGIAGGTIINFLGNKYWVFARDYTPGDHPVTLRSLHTLSDLVALGVLFRSIGLSKESLWFDELYTVYFSSGPLARAISAEPTNPPLYYVLMHFWISAFGDSEAALRSFSLAPSIVSIVLVYFLGVRLFSDRVGLLASLYMTFSSFHLFYAQEARVFSLLCMLLLLSALLAHIVLTESKPTRLALASYIFISALAIYAHFIAVFFIAAQNVFFLYRWKFESVAVGRWIATQCAIVILCIPWIQQMASTANQVVQHRQYLWLKLPQAIFSFLFGDTLVPLDKQAVDSIAETLLAYSPTLAAAIIATAILTILSLRATLQHSEGIFAWCMFAAPTIALFVISFKIMLFDERYLIGASPFLYILLAAGTVYGVRSIAARVRFATIGAVAILTILLSVSIFQYYYHPRYGKEQWREAVAYVENRVHEGDVIVFDPPHIDVCYNYYRRSPFSSSAMAIGSLLSDGISFKNTGVKDRAKVWLIRSHSYDSLLQNDIAAQLSLQHKKIFPKGLGIQVLYYTKAQPPT